MIGRSSSLYLGDRYWAGRRSSVSRVGFPLGFASRRGFGDQRNQEGARVRRNRSRSNS